MFIGYGCTPLYVGPYGIVGNSNDSEEKSAEGYDKNNRDRIRDEEDERILADNRSIIASMKYDDIKLNNYERVFNRSFTNPIGYNYMGKRYYNFIVIYSINLGC